MLAALVALFCWALSCPSSSYTIEIYHWSTNCFLKTAPTTSNFTADDMAIHSNCLYKSGATSPLVKKCGTLRLSQPAAWSGCSPTPRCRRVSSWRSLATYSTCACTFLVRIFPIHFEWALKSWNEIDIQRVLEPIPISHRNGNTLLHHGNRHRWIY